MNFISVEAIPVKRSFDLFLFKGTTLGEINFAINCKYD
jgi:hypothetical protein